MCDSHKSIISKQLELSLLFTVSKYLAFETDYINLTLTSKKNKLLLESFTYNPIPSTRLFHNLQTQYLYSSEDEPVRGVKLLVYCYPISYNFYYEMNGNRIQFKKVIYTFNDRITYGNQIPDEVSSISYCCFKQCTKITEISIPTSVTSLQNCCFEGCSKLKEIIIPTSVVSIGSECFSGCFSLTKIDLPTSLTHIGAHCFRGCNLLKSLTFLDTLPHLNVKSESESDLFTISKKLISKWHQIVILQGVPLHFLIWVE